MPQTQRCAANQSDDDGSAQQTKATSAKKIAAIKPKGGKRPASELIADMSAEKEEQERLKKSKQLAKDNLLKAYTCPMTHAVFLEPVSMSDGFTYEKRTAETYIRDVCLGSGLARSPMTKQLLCNVSLTHNIALRNAIAHSVDAGILDGPDIDEYKAGIAKLAEEAGHLKSLQMGAIAGNHEALKDLGLAHMKGLYGLKRDDYEAVKLFGRAADLNNVPGMALFGFMTMSGLGCPRRIGPGALQLAMAASKGSEFACSVVAEAYVHGRFSFPKNAATAAKFYGMMDLCDCKDADPEARRRRDRFHELNHAPPNNNEDFPEEVQDNESSSDEE
tara:strand:- start:66 stop:1061 length:996 start_codon:yes stop_codon:yes gene_type:complete